MLPESFRRNVVGAFPGGAGWLEQLPRLIKECEARWDLRVGPPFALSFNYVAPALRAGTEPVVLKMGAPNAELSFEIQALRLYAGQGAVRLLDADPERGLLLLERLTPGESVTSISDDQEATHIAAEVMLKLWRPAPSESRVPTVRKWALGVNRLRNRFDGGTGPLPVRMVEMAEKLFGELLSASSEAVLLHGDVHHFNILSSQNGWTAIDPKGVVGERAFDVAAFLENPRSALITDMNVQRRRLDILEESLGIDRGRMAAYGVAHSVLSACWSIEDSGNGWEASIACAETLARFL